MSKPQDGSGLNQEITRIAVGGYDDAQDVRTRLMNRVRDVIRKKNEGIPFDETEDEKDDSNYDSKYDDENLQDILDEMGDSGLLTDEEFQYIDKMLDAATTAKFIEDQFESALKAAKNEPIYYEWLDDVYGVSHTLTAKLLHQFGYCEDFEKVSNLWSYCGLAPGQTRERGEQLDFNPDAKTLAWLVADRMIMQGSRSMYKKNFYNPYKEKQLDRMEQVDGINYEVYEIYENGYTTPATFRVDDPDQQVNEPITEGDIVGEMLFKGTPPNTRGHADNRARRYMAKKFLKHYWAIGRDIKGLEVPDEWIITHGGHEKRTDTFDNPFFAKKEVRHR